MKAKSITGISIEEIQSELERATTDGFRPTLGLVFVPSSIDYRNIRQLLDKKGVAIFGANTPDRIMDQGIEHDLPSILLLDLDPQYFRIVLEEIPMNDYEGFVETARNIARTGLDSFSRPAFIVTLSKIELPGEALAEGILSVAGEGAPIIGGVCGGKPYWEDHAVFNNETQSNQAIICLIIDQDHVEVKGLAVSGWKAVGTPKTVTRSEGNWVYTIDDEPALEMLIKYTGIEVNLDDSDDLLRQIGNPYPLQVMLPNGSPVMKPPIMFNKENGAIYCGGHISKGAKIRFSLPPDFDIVEKVIDSARDLKKGALPVADALIAFSCVGRQVTLGPLIEEEISGLTEVWKVPMAGYFSLGEFGTPEGGKADFHGTTCSWVALKEKN